MNTIKHFPERIIRGGYIFPSDGVGLDTYLLFSTSIMYRLQKVDTEKILKMLQYTAGVCVDVRF